MDKVIVLLSGGMDSATLIPYIKDKYAFDVEIIALNIIYGQVNSRELESAKRIAEWYNIEYVELDMRDVFVNFRSSLLEKSGEEITDDGNTYVPARNTIFLAIAAGYADSIGAKYIYYGAHKDDAGGYPDTTIDYYRKMNLAIEEGTKNRITLLAPFIAVSKDTIVSIGMDYEVPYEMTHSCYKNQNPPCGECPTCKLRAKAFKDAGYEDPLIQINKGDDYFD